MSSGASKNGILNPESGYQEFNTIFFSINDKIEILTLPTPEEMDKLDKLLKISI